MDTAEVADRPQRGSGLRGPGPSRQRLALEAGLLEARAAIRRWVREEPLELARWLALSLTVGMTLMVAALLVAQLSGSTSAAVLPVFADPTASTTDAVRIAASNCVVLLMHSLICLATYLAVRSVAIRARRRDGTDRLLRELVTPLALAVVAVLTCVSLASQAWRLGHDLAPAAATLHLSPAALMVRIALHALPELTGIFLPLSACLLLVRARRHHDLLGAAVLSTVMAIPLIVAAACIEVWATRLLL